MDSKMKPLNPEETARVLQEVAERSARIFADFAGKHPAASASNAASDELGIAKAYMDLYAKMLSNPAALAATSTNLMADYMQLWQSSWMKMMGMQVSPVAVPAKGDGRFKDDDWSSNFLFDYIKQSYLITARHIQHAVANVEGLPADSEKKVAFFTRQYVDALAPSNFALTNPQVLRETVSSGGQNLLKGLNNLLSDMEKGGGNLRISMTDEKAFKLGKNVATTPGKVVFQTELMQLIQFQPTTKEACKTPLVIIPPWINKYYILDLREKNSFIKWALDQGHTVFVLSWVNPDARLAQMGFEDYMKQGPLAALDAVEKATGERKVNFIGYCLGGTLLGATLGLSGGKETDRPGAQRHLLRQPAGLLRAGRARRVHRRGAGRQPREEDERARLPRRLGDGLDLQPAARQRPGVVLRHQQLPDGQGPVPVRPAVLELGRDAHAGAHAQLLPEKHVPEEPARRAGRDLARGRADRPVEGQGSSVLHLHRGGPHRAVEDHLQGFQIPRRRGALRARRLGPHRRHRQSAVGEEISILDQ